MATTKTPAETKRAAIEATITMPEGWNSENADERAKALVMEALPLGTLKLDFEHGKVIEINAAKLSPNILAQAVMHGLKQKLVDAAAISRDTETGRAATIETKFDAVNEVAGRLLEGEWNKRREGGQTGGLLKRALIELYAGRKTSEQIDQWLGTLSDKDKAALRKNAKVAPIIERLRTEDITAKGGEAGKDLLAELEALEAAEDEAAGVEDQPEQTEGEGAAQ